MAGYGELIPRGSFPIGALLLTVDPSEVDVNVHPTKAEVRLSRERDIHDAIYRIVKESLRVDGIIPSFKSDERTGTSSEPARFSPNFGDSTRGSSYIPGVFSKENADPSLLARLYEGPSASPPITPDIVSVDRNTGEVIDSGNGKQLHPEDTGPTVSESFRLVGRFSDLYLLLQSGDDLYIVDQHTAHERVLYEETMRRVESNSLHGQNLLFPVQLELNPEQLAVFDEVEPTLNASGFAVSHFGGRMVNIEAVPSILGTKPVEKLFFKILDDIASLKKSGFDLKKAMAQSIACRSAVMAGDRLNDEAARHLLVRLLACENKYSCPHGRPTFVKISKTDIDKQFGRA
jgi:DNA mismatch repair protein MutL